MPRWPEKPAVSETAAAPPVSAAFPLAASPPPAPAAAVEDPPKADDPKPEADDDEPRCHYCACPMERHPDTGGPKDGCWHAANGCCFLPGRRELRPGHPPCDAYTKATAE